MRAANKAEDEAVSAMPRLSVAAGACLVLAPLSAFGQAQRGDAPSLGPDLACVNFRSLAQSGDQETMNRLSGVWRSQREVPGAPGVMMPGVEQSEMTRYASGELLYTNFRCFQPISAPGNPPRPQRCASATGTGYWYAKPADGDTFEVGLWMQGSDYSGSPTGPNCSLVQVHFIDDDRIENEDGDIGLKVGEAP